MTVDNQSPTTDCHHYLPSARDSLKHEVFAGFHDDLLRNRQCDAGRDRLGCVSPLFDHEQNTDLGELRRQSDRLLPLVACGLEAADVTLHGERARYDPLCLATVLQAAESQNSAIFTTCPEGFTTSVEPLLNDHGGPPFEVFCTLPSLHFAMTIFGAIFLLPSTEPCGLTISRFSDNISDAGMGAVMVPSSHSPAFATFGGGRAG